MVRAATTGAIDFAQFDPRNKTWWRRLDLILNELHREDLKTTSKIQHRHWLATALIPGLTPEQRADGRVNAENYLTQLTGLYFPWLKETLKKQSNPQESAVEAFREMYGYPGEERYEKMLQDQLAAWKKIGENWKKRGLTDEPDLSAFGEAQGGAA